MRPRHGATTSASRASDSSVLPAKRNCFTSTAIPGAAVLDGAVDPTAGAEKGDLQQAEGFEDALSTFLSTCSAAPKCAFYNGGDAQGAFDRLLNSIDATPIPSVPGRPDVSLEVAVGVPNRMET